MTSIDCNICHDFWFSNQKKRPFRSAVNVDLFASLYICENCGAYWFGTDRYAKIISEQDLEEYFPEFGKKHD